MGGASWGGKKGRESEMYMELESTVKENEGAEKGGRGQEGHGGQAVMSGQATEHKREHDKSKREGGQRETEKGMIRYWSLNMQFERCCL